MKNFKKISAVLLLGAVMFGQNVFAMDSMVYTPSSGLTTTLGVDTNSGSMMDSMGVTTGVTNNMNAAMPGTSMSGNMMMGSEMWVNVRALNVRARASALARRIGHLMMGDKVTVESKVGSWCKVSYSNKTGYVACRFLK